MPLRGLCRAGVRMMTDKNRTQRQKKAEVSEMTRRKFLDRILLTVAGSALLVVSGAKRAQAKVSKSVASYRGSPSGGRKCSGCVRYLGNGRCSKVKGTVSSNGYCDYYARRRKSGSY